MNIEDYLDQVPNRLQGTKCFIETTAWDYEGVYIRTICPEDRFLLVIHPTGATKKSLKNITCADNPLCEPDKECAIPIETITKITFLT